MKARKVLGFGIMMVSLTLPATSQSWSQQDEINMQEDYNRLKQENEYLQRRPYENPQPEIFRE